MIEPTEERILLASCHLSRTAYADIDLNQNRIRQDVGYERLMSVPGIGPIISSAIVAAIGSGDAFAEGRDFAVWLGLVPKQISTGDRTVL